MSILCEQLNVPFLQVSESDVWMTQCIFEKGKYYHIRATSGKGKSTFISCLYGLQKNYKGKIVIDNLDLQSATLNEICDFRTKKISIVFQDLKLFEDHTAFDNVEIKRQQTQYYPTEMIDEMAVQLGIQNVMQRPIHTLSYGERQRCAILRALIQPFDYLLLDEPFSHLDDENTLKASALIANELRKRNASLLLADLERDQLFPYDFLYHL